LRVVLLPRLLIISNVRVHGLNCLLVVGSTRLDGVLQQRFALLVGSVLFSLPREVCVCNGIVHLLGDHTVSSANVCRIRCHYFTNTIMSAKEVLTIQFDPEVCKVRVTKQFSEKCSAARSHMAFT